MGETYHQGDHVSYASTGVCRVEEIRRETMSKGPAKEFYILKPVADQGSTIFVPTDSEALLAKMKRLPDRKQIDSYLADAKAAPMVWEADRKLRANQYQALLKTCDTKEFLRLVGCIYHKRAELADKGKKLSASDEGILRRAEHLLQNELSFVLDVKPDDVAAYLRKALMEE